MKKLTDLEKAKLYEALIAQARKLPIYKTTRSLLRKLIWFHVNLPEIRVSQETLATDLGVCLRTVERSIKVLCDKGYVTKLPKKGFRKPNRYMLNLEVLAVPFLQKPKVQNLAGKESLRGPQAKSYRRKMSGKELAQTAPLKGKMSGNINKYIKALCTRTRGTPSETSLPEKEENAIQIYKVVSFKPSETEIQVANEMIQIMEQETQGTIKPDERYGCTPRKLFWHLKNQCGGDIDRWRAFCERVGSSDYLMGRSNGFKPPLLWLIKDDVVQKMRRGEFHRDQRPQESGFLNSSSSSGFQEGGLDTESSKDLERWLVLDRQKRAQALSPERNRELQRKFESILSQEKTWRADVFRRGGWDSPDVRNAFLDFKINETCGLFQSEWNSFSFLLKKETTLRQNFKKVVGL